MNVLCVSVTEPGRRLARRLPYPHNHGDAAGAVRRAWGTVDALVLVLATGAAVRLVAPLLGDKHTDPAVVTVDDAGRFAVALVGGHHGANELAHQVAAALGATPVVTTATDALGVPALDGLSGLVASGDVAGVTAAVLAGEGVRIDNPRRWPLPRALEELARPGSTTTWPRRPAAGCSCTRRPWWSGSGARPAPRPPTRWRRCARCSTTPAWPRPRWARWPPSTGAAGTRR